MNDEPSLFYEFGPFRLNVQERLLEKNDELVSLTPKVFETLLVLVEHSGHVLAKDDSSKRAV
jgi:DNA-binding winged helix-turn-helix (wHTH) protein